MLRQGPLSRKLMASRGIASAPTRRFIRRSVQIEANSMRTAAHPPPFPFHLLRSGSSKASSSTFAMPNDVSGFPLFVPGMPHPEHAENDSLRDLVFLKVRNARQQSQTVEQLREEMAAKQNALQASMLDLGVLKTLSLGRAGLQKISLLSSEADGERSTIQPEPSAPEAKQSTVSPPPQTTSASLSLKQTQARSLSSSAVEKEKASVTTLNTTASKERLERTTPVQMSQEPAIFNWAITSMSQQKAPYFILHRIITEVARRTNRDPTAHALGLLIQSACSEALQPSDTAEMKVTQVSNLNVALKDLLSYNHLPTFDQCKALISAFSHLKHAQSVIQLDILMRKHGIRHDQTTWPLALRFYTYSTNHTCEDIEALFRETTEMGLVPETVVFNRLLKYFSTHHMEDKMLDYLRLMIYGEVVADHETIHILSAHYCYKGMIDESVLVLMIMKKAFKLLPDPTTLRNLFQAMIRAHHKEAYSTLLEQILALCDSPKSPAPYNKFSTEALYLVAVQDAWSIDLALEVLEQYPNRQPSISLHRRWIDMIAAASVATQKEIVTHCSASIKLLRALAKRPEWTIEPAFLEKLDRHFKKLRRGASNVTAQEAITEAEHELENRVSAQWRWKRQNNTRTP